MFVPYLKNDMAILFVTSLVLLHFLWAHQAFHTIRNILMILEEANGIALGSKNIFIGNFALD